MRPQTRNLFNQYRADVIRLNGGNAANPAESFTVAPSVEQTLETRIQESSDFLRNVNSFGVSDLKGEKIGLSVGSTIASRTDTTQNDRVPTDPTALDGLSYECRQTNFDTALRYAKIDQWSKFPDFQARLRDAIVQQQGRDRLMIGFNGQSAAGTTNRVANPLLQDVNIGWLKKLQTNAAARYMTQGGTTGEIRVGNGGDYANLDELVYDMRSALLEPWYSRDNAFVAIVSCPASSSACRAAVYSK